MLRPLFRLARAGGGLGRSHARFEAADRGSSFAGKTELPRKHTDARFEIVEHDGAPARPDRHARTPDAVLIVDIALIASWRGQGIGASLVNGVLDEARAAGLPVRLFFANNAAALRFYLCLGFKPVESCAIGMRLEWRDPSHEEAEDAMTVPDRVALPPMAKDAFCTQSHASRAVRCRRQCAGTPADRTRTFGN